MAGVLRKRQPGRRGAALGQRLRADGLCHTQPVPQRQSRSLARGSKLTELAIARAARSAASDGAADDDVATTAVGSRLPPDRDGRRAFETAIGYRAPLFSAGPAGSDQRRGAANYIGGDRAVRGNRSCATALCARRMGPLRRCALALLALLGSHSGARCRRRAGESRRHQRVRCNDPARSGAARRRATASANARGRSHLLDHAAPQSKSRSTGSRSTIWPLPRASCTSRCCRTGSTPRPNLPRRCRRCSRSRPWPSRG